MPVLLDSSLIFEMPSIFLSLTSSAIFSMSLALLTWKGISVTMIWDLPLEVSSISVLALTWTFPCPVRYASWAPLLPMMTAPVGKSGPLMIFIRSSTVVSSSSIIFTAPSMTSPRLWGGMDVAMPTAIPLDPFTRRFGNLDGSTTGSFSSSSKLGMKSTVSLSMSRSISSENGDILASV